MLGVLLIDKPDKITSHDAVNEIRRRFGTRRVGHAGTLDPLATGLLVAAVGAATRFLQYLPLEPKEYRARFAFGRATTTFDAEGEVTGGGPVPADLRGEIEAHLERFRGLISQLPPMYSAVKVDGTPLYRYARQGREIAREPRNVHISVFEPLGAEGGEVDFSIVCSGGTYVRSLADDLGRALGCGAHLARLVRTRVGRFDLESASPLDAISPEALRPLAEALAPMPVRSLSPEETRWVRDGRTILAPGVEGPLVALADSSGAVFGIARARGESLYPECVIPSEAFHGAV